MNADSEAGLGQDPGDAGGRRAARARGAPKGRRRAFPGAAAPSALPPPPDEPLPPAQETLGTPSPGPDAAITLLPIGTVDLPTLEMLRRPVEEVFERRTEVGEGLPMPKYAYNPTREQYHSSAILKRVEEARDPAWDAAIGITEADLFVPEVQFIFGEADRSTRSALISLRRLRPEGLPVEARREQLSRRFISEVVHQIGLIRGLAHCPNNRCVMFDASTVAEIDKRGASLCANCRKRLAVAT